MARELNPPEPGGGFAEFGDYYRSDDKKLIAFVMRLGASRQEAEDACHDAMEEIFKRWNRVGTTNPAAYARTVAERRYIGSKARAASDLTKLAEAGWGNIHPDTVIFSKKAQDLLQLMETLSFQQRRVLAWNLDGFSTREIAEMTDQHEATVRSNLRHAKDKMRSLFNAQLKKMAPSAGRRPADEREAR